MASLFSNPVALRRGTPLNSKEFHLVRGLSYKATNIDIPERREYPADNRLGPRLKELNLIISDKSYQYLISSSSKNKWLAKLYQKITTNDTCFFGDTKSNCKVLQI